ncbi:UNVERIFIED_CONTAM: hypothetical protein Slati_0383900 [Sesamum latifolium]|uniref:MULE transposase domain-containing protein n=1 Tax=Sesamum latifolium TaxID=2727402 RepID=A0AAW2YGY7_9LAMI
MYEAPKKGFLEGCRPVIGLDAYFLKGPFGGQLMAAIARDGNNQMFPLAIVVVESECRIVGHGFFVILMDVLGGTDGRQWTFISDRQKELVETFQDLVPSVDHRFCVRHLYANFKLRFKDKALKDLMWGAACSYVEEGFINHMNQIKEISNDAYQWLMNIPTQRWCIPCVHATCSILTEYATMEEHVNEYFHVAKYKQTYEAIIHPIPDPKYWIETIEDRDEMIMPPLYRRQPGRPKKARKKSPDEVNNGGNITRRCTVIACSNCGETTHNKKTCKKPPQDKQVYKNQTLDAARSTLEPFTQSSTLTSDNINTVRGTGRDRGMTMQLNRGRGRGRPRGRGRSNGPLTGYGNWNGIEMSNMNYFVPVVQDTTA